MSKLKFILILLIVIASFKQLQPTSTDIKEQLIALTPEWKGERFPDGRPKVPDDIINRMKPVTVEEAWAII